MNDMQALMKEFRQRFEASVTAQENALKEAQAKFEATLKDAQAQLGSAMSDDAVAEPKLEGDAPAAAWITAPDGEQMMVINKEAVVMFMAIFDRMAQAAESLQKMSRKR
jgi:hypothetical protein